MGLERPRPVELLTVSWTRVAAGARQGLFHARWQEQAVKERTGV